jgi:uncharacterized ion transporter superfamily protein YfcC
MINVNKESVIRTIVVIIFFAIISAFTGLEMAIYYLFVGLTVGLIGRLGVYFFNKVKSGDKHEKEH